MVVEQEGSCSELSRRGSVSRDSLSGGEAGGRGGGGQILLESQSLLARGLEEGGEVCALEEFLRGLLGDFGRRTAACSSTEEEVSGEGRREGRRNEGEGLLGLVPRFFGEKKVGTEITSIYRAPVEKNPKIGWNS